MNWQHWVVGRSSPQHVHTFLLPAHGLWNTKQYQCTMYTPIRGKQEGGSFGRAIVLRVFSCRIILEALSVFFPYLFRANANLKSCSCLFNSRVYLIIIILFFDSFAIAKCLLDIQSEANLYISVCISSNTFCT